MKPTLESGEDVKFSGLFTFVATDEKHYKGRDLRTGESTNFKAERIKHSKTSAVLKPSVNRKLIAD
jgi:nucleoid DNA-binding protein